MTITKLIKELEKIKKDVGPKTKVSVNAREMLDSCNGAFDIVQVGNIKSDTINLCDGDGFQIFNKDGSERMHQQIILSF